MKQLVYSILLIVCCASAYADTYSTIYTKGGQAIEVIIRDEWYSETEIQEINDECCEDFPLATLLADATSTYNCHSYAWNLSDGGTTVCWINQFTASGQANLSKYWTNDYYSETTEANAVKVFYYLSDHSAIVSPTVTGMYESKWGSAPLMRHAPSYGPYLNMSYRKYYKHIVPTPTTGFITCSNGIGSIGRNVAANYCAVMSSSSTITMVCSIETAKGDDAIEEGYAVVNNTFSNGVNVTFTRVGIYEMYLNFYNQFNELLGSYWFEPVVTQ